MKHFACLAALALALPLACGGSDTTSSSGSSSSAGASGGTGGTGAAGGSGGTGGVGGSTSSSASSSSSGTGGMAPFALTSTGFTEGMVIPDKYACKGANISPPLAWTPGPPGTLAYAVVFTDKSNNLTHWVIWDIPAAVNQLPEHMENAPNPAIPAGAKQVKSYDNQTFGYLGPCPPNTHTYEFAVHAIDVATLPNVTTASSRPQVAAEIANHDLGSTALSGTFTP